MSNVSKFPISREEVEDMIKIHAYEVKSDLTRIESALGENTKAIIRIDKSVSTWTELHTATNSLRKFIVWSKEFAVVFGVLGLVIERFF